MPNVVRFALSSERDLYVPGLGTFHDGILDVPVSEAEMVSRARYLVRAYGAVELGITDSTTPYPALPATGPGDPLPDPYPQYATIDEVVASTAVRAAFVTVVNAGSNLGAARPAGAAVVMWKFSAGTAVGTGGANVANRQPGDLVFVADA